MKHKIQASIIYSYILLPILIFFLGWMKLYFAIPLCALILYSIWRAIENESPLFCSGESFTAWIPILVVIGLWVYFSGIGGMVFQNTDHECRNAIFNILVTEKWPVVMDMEIGGVPTGRALVYYIGFWLPAAIFGKVFGLAAGYIFQMLWAAIGILIVFWMICDYFQKFSIKYLLGFIFFSGLDILGCLLISMDFTSLGFYLHLESWSTFQFSCLTTQLFWVFNQAIYGWVLTFLILRQKNNRVIVMIWGCGLLSCTLLFVGMLPFLVYKIIKNTKENLIQNPLIKGDKLVNQFKQAVLTSEIFTIENILAGGFIGILTFLYEKGNGSANNNGSIFPYSKGYLFLLILFLVVEMGIYAFLIYKDQCKKPLYWICVLTLCICPLIRVGGGIDFCMRASIPSLLVLMILFFESWEKYREKKNWILWTVCTIVFLTGAVTPSLEFCRTATKTSAMYHNSQTIMSESTSIEGIMTSPNFSGDIEGNLFFEYLTK